MNTSLLRIVVTDANVLINLMHVSRLGLLAKIPNHEFVVPEHVREEITAPDQRATLDAAVSEGWLKIEAINDLDALVVFTELIARIGRGEAACIAIAAKSGWLIASDERKRFLREATARVGVGRVMTTVDVFVLAIRGGLLTVEDADADKRTLEGRRFKASFGSFGNSSGSALTRKENVMNGNEGHPENSSGGQGNPGGDKGNNTVTIVVDGSPQEVNKGTIRYAEIVTLAYADYPQHPEITYSVIYKKGPPPNPEGILSAGGHVVVKDGMVFNVSRTGQS